MRGFRTRKKLSRKEALKAKEVEDKRNEAFDKKCAEFEPKTLDELKDLYNSPERPGGTYLRALFFVTNKKLNAKKEQELADKLAELKEKEVTDVEEPKSEE